MTHAAKTQKALRRIQKLQALAASDAANGNEKAADAALAAAERLKLQYELSQASVDATDTSDDPQVAHEASTGKRLKWIRYVFSRIAEVNGCYGVSTRGSSKFTFYGRTSDCEIAEYLATYIVAAIERRADAYVKQCRAEWGSSSRTERTNFCWSAAVVIGKRLSTLQREAAAEAREEHGDAAVSNALVRLDNKLVDAKAFAHARVRVSKGRGVRFGHSDAGAKAGREINLSKGLAGGSAVRGQLGG